MVMGKAARHRRLPLGEAAQQALRQWLALRPGGPPWMSLRWWWDRGPEGF